MTKDDIKKALEICADINLNCNDCPYDAVGNCTDTLCADALNLITEQEKEIDALKAENEKLTKVVSSKVYDLIDNTKEIADAREAWEQQAKIEVLNEVKKLSHCDNFFTDGKWHRYVFIDDIEKLLEELKR